MATTPTPRTSTSDVAIFGRLLNNHKGQMSPTLARYVLTLGFSDADQERMRELAATNQRGALAPLEHEELMSYVKAGHLLAVLHSKARKARKRHAAS